MRGGPPERGPRDPLQGGGFVDGNILYRLAKERLDTGRSPVVLKWKLRLIRIPGACKLNIKDKLNAKRWILG